MKKTASLILAFLIIFSALFSSCGGGGSDKPENTTQTETTAPDTTESESTTEETTTEESTTEPPITKSTVTLIAVGDNLIHNPLITSGK
ncbi:MAG: hypothetical protein IJ404_03885 [Clostridia bacterium]|nr:hypothetical protein [Clostridia bacterium]